MHTIGTGSSGIGPQRLLEISDVRTRHLQLPGNEIGITVDLRRLIESGGLIPGSDAIADGDILRD